MVCPKCGLEAVWMAYDEWEKKKRPWCILCSAWIEVKVKA